MKKSSRNERIVDNNEADVLTRDEQQQTVKLLNRQLQRVSELSKLELSDSSGLGSKDSAHGVFFARNTRGEGVAIKRFRRPDAANAELAATQQAHARGFRTLEVVGEGGFSAGELGTVVVTRQVPNLSTMNQIGWSNAMPGEEAYGDIASTLRSIAEFTGKMHAAGIAHGDWQVKNVAQVPTGEFVLFDLEGAKMTTDPEGDFDFGGQCTEDLVKLTSSLVTRGYLKGVSSQVFGEELATQVLDPYWGEYPTEQALEAWESTVLPAAFEVREQEVHAAQLAMAAGNVAVRPLVR